MTSKTKKKTTPSLDHDSPNFNSTKDKTTNQRIKEYESLIAPSERFGKMKYEEQNHTQQLKTTETTSTAAAASNLSEEELLRKCRVDEDPIKHWEQYIEYIKQIYPNDSHLYFDILERCTYSLLHHPKYKNDDRFIQFIVIYADQLDDDSIKERRTATEEKNGIREIRGHQSSRASELGGGMRERRNGAIKHKHSSAPRDDACRWEKAEG